MGLPDMEKKGPESFLQKEPTGHLKKKLIIRSASGSHQQSYVTENDSASAFEILEGHYIQPAFCTKTIYQRGEQHGKTFSQN